MALLAGTRLGPYEIRAPLGAGGMGEVYRARDARLERDVAVKVLPEGVARTPAVLARFEREARAVAALSHPGIVALFDVGEENGVRYVVTELLDGETLRALAGRGPLPVRRALEIVSQIAEALAAAHEGGIVHRDVKPENVIVTKDRRARLLDFGLAAWSEPTSGFQDGTKSPTAPVLTGDGAVLGTVAYMSPEQARGNAVDFRSDLFSLGIILYELLAGTRPFVRPSAPETLAAIIRDEPEPLSRRAPRTPPPVRWLVERLLSKDPDERYASTRDLVREMRILLVNLSEATPGPVPAARVPARRRRAVLLASLGAAAACGVMFHAGERAERARSHPLSFRRLTFHHGWVGRARFTPDGQTVVYGAGWDGQVPDVYALRLDGHEARPLGFPQAGLLALSRSSELALSLDVDTPRRFAPSKLVRGPWKVALAPFGGGAPRALATGVFAADFGPDGTTLAVAHSPAQAAIQVEYPLGNVVRKGPLRGTVEHLRVSPDGQRVAFLECDPSRLACNVAVADRSGETRILSSDYDEAEGLAWSPGGDEIWFGATRSSWRREVRGVRLDGRERLVLSQLDSVIPQDVDSRGRLLVKRHESRTRVLFRGEGEASERDLSWFERSAVNDLSLDGQTIVFQELGDATEGRNVIYVRPTDGAAPVRLGEGRYSTISPDGRTVVSAHLDGNAFILYPLGPEPSRTVPLPGFYVDAPHLHPDGRTVVFEGSESPDRPERLWRTDVSGSRPLPLTPEGVLGRTPFLTPDGLHVLAKRQDGFVLYPLDGSEPVPVRGIAIDERTAGWADDGRSLFAFRPGESPLRIFLVDVRSGTRKPWREIVLADGVQAPTVLRLTPNGKSWVYFFWRFRSDLHLVEGLE